jgi:RNA recognition motif-containing protein
MHFNATLAQDCLRRYRKDIIRALTAPSRINHNKLENQGEMEAKLYVGNLSYTSSEDDLKALFAQAGTVKSVTIIKDRDTGRSKGFGFVEMETAEEAQKAITMFHNYQFQQRTLTVNIARPREDRSGGGGGGYRGGGSRSSGSRPGNRQGGDRRRDY